MKNLAAIFAGILGVLISLGPVAAQPGPVGIAFTQAEGRAWWCRDNDPNVAIACANEKCESESNSGGCHPTRWCSPAGWSGLMIVWLPEFRSPIPLCGTSGESALLAALKALCDGSSDITRCDLVAVIDPAGNERLIEGEAWFGPTVTEGEMPEGQEQLE